MSDWSLVVYPFCAPLFWYLLFRVLSLVVDEALIAQKLVCVLHALLSTAVGAYALLFQDALRADLINGKWPLLHSVMAPLSIGYFVVDLTLMMVRKPSPNADDKDWLASVVHHTVMLLAIGAYLWVGRGDFVVASFMVWELSTPFVHLRWYLVRRGWKASCLYLFNGVALVVTFFLARICNLPFVIWLFARQRQLGVLEALWVIPPICRLVTSSIFLLNVFWFVKIVNGALKVVRGDASGKST
eukprot:CAMPEP_0203920128 /NCGR_PEP_ID=MMETSP0359-20131031/60472_1 /ASSEMBLY_ACC=CAM_ASM_000338 /TAXON_ID=268821 /ORGANISM="Scrippsiella Hangoei, Strain SHTV-5" /LENGTH=242 /DNA_ID=CAMNT_0050847567 /DNA_START=9 /DNA_END=737 /DNA_ORIENTATION=-